MKDEIKTFDDYKALVKEYVETDSVSRRESIEDAVYDKAKELLHKLRVLYAKYGKDYVNDSDYREDRGCLSLIEFNEYKVYMNYSDRWAYGGECDIGIEVQMKYLDNDKMTVLEKELREEHIWAVKKKIQAKKEKIEQLKKEIEELEAEYFQHQDKEEIQ
jgi:hypothetical protein